MRYEEALRAAESVMDWLRPAVWEFEPGGSLGSISIAGSLRRKVQKEYSELDIIMIPDLSPLPLPRAVFGKPIPTVYKYKIEKLIGEASEGGRIIRKSGGDRNIKFYFRDLSIDVDLYIIKHTATWGVISMIRTGPESFGHWIVTRRSGRAYDPYLGNLRGGALPDGYRVQAGAVWEGEEKIPEKDLLSCESIGFETEESFFEFLGLPWLEPEERVARWRSRP